MKAKRFLSILLAAMMMLSCFVIGASAEAIKTDEKCTLIIHLTQTTDTDKEKLDENDTVTGEATTVTGADLEGAVFTLFDSEGNETKYSGTTNKNGEVTITDIPQGRYTVKNTAKAPAATKAYVDFQVDLPMTNPNGDGFLYAVSVYPKQIATGAVELTKTFNGHKPDTGFSADFSLYKLADPEAEPDMSKDQKITTESNPYSWQTDENGKIFIDGLEMGTYYFAETGISTAAVEAGYPRIDQNNFPKTNKFTISKAGTVVNDVTYGEVVKVSFNNVSSTVPTVDKKVKRGTEADNDTVEWSHSANIDSYNGENAVWRIAIQVPNDIKDYKYFEIVDVIDNRLTFVGDNTNIQLGVTGGAGVASITTQMVEEKKIENGTITVKFVPSEMNSLAGKEIYIKYETKIATADGTITTGENIPNHVTLKYVNASGKVKVPDPTPEDPDRTTDTDFDPENPDKTPPEKTENPKNPEDPENPDPYVWTGKIDIFKYSDDAKTGGKEGGKSALSDVEFTLTRTENGSVIKDSGSVKTDANGKITLPGLLDGTYTLTETKAKAGYELIGTPITIVVENGKVTDNFADVALVSLDENNVVNIENIPSTDLPLTGGMGTAMFAILGLALVAVGGVLFFKSRKAKAC